jgi:fibronectin-binding autotransporter adhesin
MKISIRKILLICGFSLFFVIPAFAEEWNVNSAGMWTNGPNWTSSTVPSGTDSIAVFGSTITAARNVTNDVAITNGTIIFDSSQIYRLIPASGGRIYFDVSSGNALIVVSNQNGSATKSFIVPFTMLDALTINNLSTNALVFGGTGMVISNSGNTLTVGGSGFTIITNQIVDAGGLTKTDSGTLYLRGANTYSGGTLVSNGTLMGISSSLQGTFTNHGTVLHFNAAAATNAITTMVGSGSLVVSNTSNIGTFFTNLVAHSGSTIVQNGIMFLTNALGSVSNSSAIWLNRGGTLQLANNTTANDHRVKDTASLNLNGGTFVLHTGTETIGTVTNFGGYSTINTTNGAQLTASAMVRGDNRATVNFLGIGTGSNIFTTAPTLDDGILPYATVDRVDFATHDGNGTAIQRYNGYVTTFSANAANNVISTGDVQTISASITNNSLVLGQNLIIDPGVTLRLDSGAMILNSNGLAISGGTLSFGDSEAIIFANSNATISSVLAGTNGLTKSGQASLVLASASSLTVKLTVNDGTLALTNSSSLTLGSTITVDRGARLTLDGGTLSGTQLIATNGAFQFNYGTLTLSQGSIIGTNDDIFVGTVGGTISTWNMTGGTNIMGIVPDTDRVYFGRASGATAFVNVVGNNTVLTNTAGIFVGDSGIARMVVSNGAKVYSQAGTSIMGNISSSTNNLLLVSDSGSLVSMFIFTVGDDGSDNTLIVSNSATFSTLGLFRMGLSSGSRNATIITDSGSSINSASEARMFGTNNVLTITNSGKLILTTSSNLVVNGASNQVFIAGSGSLVSNAGDVYIGNSRSYNELNILSGGKLYATGAVFVSEGVSSTNNKINVSGANSLLQLGGSLFVGTNSMTDGTGEVLIQNMGTLESAGMESGYGGSGTISNRGGIFQFTTATPTITTNTVDSIISTNGIVSFKGVTSADINTSSIAQITYQGTNNSFQLNNSTGSFHSAYTFGAANGANFQHLIMVEGGTRWQGTNTTLNTGGIWTFSNTTATVFGTTTNNAGTMRISATNSVSSSVTFEKSLVVGGVGDGNGAIQNLRATNTISAPMTLSGNSTISSASGKLTVAGAITNGGNTLTVGGAGNVTLAAQISGTGGLAINGGGTVTISNTSANTFSGATTVTNSTVRLSKAGALGATSGITLSASGTLLFDGGAVDHVGNGVAVTMDGGAITLNNITETLGTLTLKSNSTITLNYDGSVGDLVFSDTAAYEGGTLTIIGWNGPSGTGGGGDDRIFFTSNAGGVNMLNNITFQGFAPGATRLGTGEIIPNSVPEPGTIIGSLIVSLLGTAHWIRRHARTNKSREN